MNTLNREWDEEWVGGSNPANGKPINLHRIDLTLDFPTAFMFDWLPKGQTHTRHTPKRRSILDNIRADLLGTEKDCGNEPYVPVAPGLQAQRAKEALIRLFKVTQEKGWDIIAPGAACLHGLHITARMPNRYTGAGSDMVDVHAMAFLPVPITLKDLILFAPASLIFPPTEAPEATAPMNLYLVQDSDYVVAPNKPPRPGPLAHHDRANLRSHRPELPRRHRNRTHPTN